ncbi:MAG: glycoside hydrolase family 2 TIM barrel-domain containing protein, partial [Ignavibacteria bacterium]
MIFTHSSGFLFSLILILSLSPVLGSQPLILQRSSSQVPERFVKKIENEHRKLITLNGEWDFYSSEPYINTKVRVPFCYDFKGSVNCGRTFNIDTEEDGSWNYVLYCDGINYQCEISINGRFIIKHEGGFTQFSSLIPEGILKSTENRIEIKIDNSLDYTTIPLKNNNNYPKNYGGIYRDIYILAVPKLFIKNINVSTEIDINFNADIRNQVTLTSTDLTNLLSLTDGDKNFAIKTEILDTSGEIKSFSEAAISNISANSTTQIINNLTFSSPELWSADNPYLYTIRVTLSAGDSIIDIYSIEFGIQELKQKSGSIFINKSEMKFKGINYIEEFSGSGICGTYEDTEKDIRSIKSLGCNAVKVYGRPASPYLVDICNRHGMLIFEELPVFNVPAEIMDSENFISLAEYQFTEMILSHKNNPSVFAYGIGNDFDVSDDKSKNFVSRLVTQGKSLDKRIIYYSTRNYKNDICRELVDLAGINFYAGDLRILKEIAEEVKLNKEKLFLSNYGKIINPKNLSGYSDPSSIESQSKLIVEVYKIIKGSSLSGGFFLSYSDWNSDFPNLLYYGNNHFLRTTGLYTLNREQRTPAVILKKEYSNEDIPNLNIGSYSKESPIFFVLLGICVFILFVYLANGIRRIGENVMRALFRPFIFFTDVREQSLIQPIYNILLAVILSLGNGLFFGSLLYYWK